MGFLFGRDSPQRGGNCACCSIGSDAIDRTGIPQFGREWMAREDHV
jgi:hypothetical protein